ncbi:MAG: BamA/TamA family outer membrane protein [Polyangiales bacterium]
MVGARAAEMPTATATTTSTSASATATAATTTTTAIVDAAVPESCPCATTPCASIATPQADKADPSLRYVIESIVVRGNSRTRERVVLRFVPFVVGETFDVDDPRLDLTRFRLLGTGYFKDVQLSLRRGSTRGAVVMVVEVVERNTIVINDLWLGVSADANPDGSSKPLTAYGGADVAETNFLGTGVSLSAAVALADRQQGYRVRLTDPAFLGGPYIASFSLLYNNARDFFGNKDVLYDAPIDPSTGLPSTEKTDYAVASYTRKGGDLAFGADLSTSARLRFGYHLEWIDAYLPAAASELRGTDVVPIQFHLIPGRSYLSMLSAQLDDDTRDDPFLPTRGHSLQIGADLGVPVLGSDYSFLRLVARYSHWWSVGFHDHVLRLDMFAGAIFGDAPLFERFFIGDLSDFLPDRVLDLNFDRRPPPNFLRTDVEEMRYEEFAGRIGAEYRIPLYRGQRSVYGIDLFGSAGIYGLASQRDLTNPAAGYGGFSKIPIDLTFNLGLRISTSAGGFLLGISNAIGFFPIRSEARQ